MLNKITFIALAVVVGFWQPTLERFEPEEVTITGRRVDLLQALPDLECLAQNMYWEANNQNDAGILAVGRVTLARTRDRRFPSDICGVVYEARPGLCQFSWTCDGRAHHITDRARYRHVQRLAVDLYLGAINAPDATRGAIYYHADYTPPEKSAWFRNTKTRVAKIGAHTFYAD